ncbi:membrane-associated kinase regulator [Thalictrum thalictroides]|uniref:Membrane-associated kinase regulator n=1 Tax=Thalictrum thalictroides TaxID=46969 RepID=A0A7J6WCV8_THATH|nr:membrane-associated kinase regulator [Thalictrum thalictroides]
MVRTLLFASPSSSSSSDTSASRDSTGSSNSNDSNSSSASDLVLLNADCTIYSARPSSVIEEEDGFKRVQIKKSSKYFSLSRFSSVFRKEGKNREQEKVLKKGNSTKEVIRKYLKKVKPLYDKFSSQKQKTEMGLKMKSMKDKEIPFSLFSVSSTTTKTNNGVFSNSFSGNLKYPRRRRCVSSCPSSMRSSPSHSHSILPRSSLVTAKSIGSATKSSDFSSMEELQSAIQGAIAHCKNSMIQDTTSIWVSKETI